jgi:hypothetical protein
LFGKDVERWHVGWEGWWVIFPYFRHEGRYRFMPSSEYWDFELTRGNSSHRVFEGYPEDSPRIDEEYPKLWAYLKTHEAALRGREGGRFKRGKREEWRWYDLARPQSLEASSQGKIVAQLLARSAQFATDEGGAYFQAGGKGGGVYGILLHPTWDEHLFLGLLNSKTLDFHLRHISSVYSSGFYSYADAFLKDLPIGSATNEQQQAIIAAARTLIEKTAVLREREKAVAAFPDSVTGARRQEGDVPDLEVLSRLGLFGNLPREVRADRLGSEHDLMGQVVLRIGNGRMTLKPALARLVEKVLELRGKMARDELLALNVPEREVEQRAYLETLATWQTEIACLQEEIAGLEAELNDTVYEVYGLDEEDRRVVEGFLDRF